MDTPPVKAATQPGQQSSVQPAISIHAAREGGDQRVKAFRTLYPISIHAAREGGDPYPTCFFVRVVYISIHAAREGGDSRPHEPQICAFISIHAAREGGDRISGED